MKKLLSLLLVIPLLAGCVSLTGQDGVPRHGVQFLEELRPAEFNFVKTATTISLKIGIKELIKSEDEVSKEDVLAAGEIIRGIAEDPVPDTAVFILDTFVRDSIDSDLIADVLILALAALDVYGGLQTYIAEDGTILWTERSKEVLLAFATGLKRAAESVE
jgi:hypothetical protein